MRLSSVLLPQPDGPMIDTSSPAAMSRLMLCSASVSTRSVRYTLSTSFSVIIVPPLFVVRCWWLVEERPPTTSSLDLQFLDSHVIRHVRDHHLVPLPQPVHD